MQQEPNGRFKKKKKGENQALIGKQMECGYQQLDNKEGLEMQKQKETGKGVHMCMSMLIMKPKGQQNWEVNIEKYRLVSI